jgi:ribonuclease HI
MTSFVKINTDASFQEQTRSGGWGAICRDEMSDIRFAEVGPLATLLDAFHAEALALSNAIDVVGQLGVERCWGLHLTAPCSSSTSNSQSHSCLS